ncbi:hypothetical protein UFOVP1672_9 [uncultured Caudovirales phage]|uniref:Uncharacterized protein n=1 Tax=uncultured Caudovirales phage TaxID=2100421 RepID=A0A6J5PZ57_9CAUD|nr:hypothetical protein UFOVP988_31 [uncultured Caudovirales phage]CAB4210682.1 hypothetical protein UFOVP1425_31 [uncultured Caudovirales phage]CAB4223270.1 hypothetical protein UFOVP1672_9 [uncultured Caudovirales phage]
MAVALTNKTSGENEAATTANNTASVTLATGDLLIVRTGAFRSAGSLVAPSSITWNGNNLTSLVARDLIAGFSHESIWYYQVSSGGSAVVTINYATAPDSVMWCVDVATGHDTAVLFRDNDSAGFAGGASPTITMTSVSGDYAVDIAGFAFAAATAFGPAGGQTQDYETDLAGDPTGYGCGSKAATGTTITMNYSGSFGSDACILGAVIQQSPPPAGASRARQSLFLTHIAA